MGGAVVPEQTLPAMAVKANIRAPGPPLHNAQFQRPTAAHEAGTPRRTGTALDVGAVGFLTATWGLGVTSVDPRYRNS
jgi:hypothetical protein